MDGCGGSSRLVVVRSVFLTLRASNFAMYGLPVRRTSYNSFPGVDIYEHAIPGAELEYVNPGSHQNRIGSSQLVCMILYLE